jgi:hypothetical protein
VRERTSLARMQASRIAVMGHSMYYEYSRRSSNKKDVHDGPASLPRGCLRCAARPCSMQQLRSSQQPCSMQQAASAQLPCACCPRRCRAGGASGRFARRTNDDSARRHTVRPRRGRRASGQTRCVVAAAAAAHGARQHPPAAYPAASGCRPPPAREQPPIRAAIHQQPAEPCFSCCAAEHSSWNRCQMAPR